MVPLLEGNLMTDNVRVDTEMDYQRSYSMDNETNVYNVDSHFLFVPPSLFNSNAVERESFESYSKIWNIESVGERTRSLSKSWKRASQRASILNWSVINWSIINWSVRLCKDDIIKTNLVTAKSKIVPIKKLTVPRL